VDIQVQVKPELWTAVTNSYQAGNYTNAIRDAMLLLTESLRDKSGLDGDGDPLAGKALGFSEGKPPLIRINKFQTETEQNEQRGFMFAVKGLYALVRNSRSHERLSDTQQTADRIILFIDYLLDFLGASQQSFTVDGFVNCVTEAYFVKDAEYVQELVNTIPVRKPSDTLIQVYRAKTWQRADNVNLALSAILSKMQSNGLPDFLAVVSDELMRTQKPSEVTLIIRVLPQELWCQLSKTARLRAENMLQEDFDSAWYIPEDDKTYEAAPTWLSNITPCLYRKDSIAKPHLTQTRKRRL
jgi:uncharacterized protein (TIGR02391 family)